MSKLARFALVAALFVTIVFGASARGAFAKTYEHGRIVFFSNQTIGEDDIINGDLTVLFGNVTCESGAVITGNVRVYSGQFTQLDGCQVGGEAIELGTGQLGSLVPWPDVDLSTRALVDQNRHVLRHIAYDVVVLFAFLLFPVRVRVALERVERHPGLSAATGTLAAVAVVPLAILLLLSVIGIPLIVVEVAAVFAGLWIGQAAVAIIVGRRLFELLRPHATPTPLGALVLGLIVVSASELLPTVGWVVTALVSLIGLGAAILAFVRETAFTNFTQTPPSIGGAPPPISGVPMRSA